MKIYLLGEKYPDKDRLIYYQIIPNESGLGVVCWGKYLGTRYTPKGEMIHEFSDADRGGTRISVSDSIHWSYYEDLQSQYNVQHEKAVMADLDTISDSENLQEKVEQAEEIMQEALEWIDEMPFKKVHRRVRDLMHQFIYGGQYRIDEKEY